MDTIIIIFAVGCTAPSCENEMYEAIIRISDPDLTRTWEEDDKFTDLEDYY